jgi:hypothetical protein
VTTLSRLLSMSNYLKVIKQITLDFPQIVFCDCREDPALHRLWVEKLPAILDYSLRVDVYSNTLGRRGSGATYLAKHAGKYGYTFIEDLIKLWDYETDFSAVTHVCLNHEVMNSEYVRNDLVINAFMNLMQSNSGRHVVNPEILPEDVKLSLMFI